MPPAPTGRCGATVRASAARTTMSGCEMTDRFNAQTYLVTRNVEDGLGDKVAVRAPETTTYEELDELCGVVAAALREAGVRSDDRVLLMMSDGLPMLAAILGCFRAGAVAVPVSTMQTATELGTVLADS